jgi:hypothetical protein
MSRRASSCAVVGGAVVAYFVIFPDDLGVLERLLKLTRAVAPGAYAVLVAVVVVAGAVRIWGRRIPSVGPVAPAERSGPT